jgi:hypothetical protein
LVGEIMLARKETRRRASEKFMVEVKGFVE